MNINQTNFDKEIIGDKRYRDAIIKAMSEKGGYNLSRDLSALLGYYNNFNNNKVVENGFLGCFERESHGAYSFNHIRNEAAIGRLTELLKLDSILIDEVNDNTFSKYIYKDDMTIYRNNVIQIFNNIKITKCIKCPDGIERQIEMSIENKFQDNDECILYLPILIFNEGKRFIKFLFQEIASHCFCNHESIGNSNKIILRGQSVGLSNQCLFLLVLEIDSKNPWKTKNGELKPPKRLVSANGKISEFESQKMNLYCDYLILAPSNGDYYFIQIYKSSNPFKFNKVENNDATKISSRDRFEINISYNNNKIIIKNTQDNNRKLEINDTLNNSNRIFHVFLFNNHQKT